MFCEGITHFFVLHTFTFTTAKVTARRISPRKYFFRLYDSCRQSNQRCLCTYGLRIANLKYYGGIMTRSEVNFCFLAVIVMVLNFTEISELSVFLPKILFISFLVASGFAFFSVVLNFLTSPKRTWSSSQQLQ